MERGYGESVPDRAISRQYFLLWRSDQWQNTDTILRLLLDVAGYDLSVFQRPSACYVPVPGKRNIGNLFNTVFFGRPASHVLEKGDSSDAEAVRLLL